MGGHSAVTSDVVPFSLGRSVRLRWGRKRERGSRGGVEGEAEGEAARERERERELEREGAV